MARITNRLRAVVSEEQIPESVVEETEMSRLSDSEQPVRRRLKRTRVPCCRYSAPEWSYYVDSGYVTTRREPPMIKLA